MGRPILEGRRRNSDQAAALFPLTPQAHAQPSLSSGTVMAAVERLRPGEYLWTPEVAPQRPNATEELRCNEVVRFIRRLASQYHLR